MINGKLYGKNSSSKLNLVVFLLSVMLLPLITTSSYFVSVDQANSALEFAQKIVVIVDGNENNDLNLIQNSNNQNIILNGATLNVSPIKLKVMQANIPFVLRLKVDLQVTGSNETTKQALKTGILNAMGLSNQNSWVELWGHYYYIGSSTGDYVMKKTVEGNEGTGSQTINGSQYDSATTRTKPTTEDDILNMTLTSISGKTQSNLIEFSTGGAYTVPGPSELELNGETVSLNVEVETIQDFLIKDSLTVLPTTLNAFDPLDPAFP